MAEPSVAERWDEHWRRAVRPAAAAHPYLASELGALEPGIALDAGCGAGAEAVWLARRGWRVTGVDVSATALERAAGLAADAGVVEAVDWIRADLTTWTPDTSFDLVTAHYAHPDMPPTAFHARLASWVAPGGTLLVVAHRRDHGAAGTGSGPSAAASTTLADVVSVLDPAEWRVITAAERDRTPQPSHHPHDDGVLRDVVVRAVRRP